MDLPSIFISLTLAILTLLGNETALLKKGDCDTLIPPLSRGVRGDLRVVDTL